MTLLFENNIWRLPKIRYRRVPFYAISVEYWFVVSSILCVTNIPCLLWLCSINALIKTPSWYFSNCVHPHSPLLIFQHNSVAFTRSFLFEIFHSIVITPPNTDFAYLINFLSAFRWRFWRGWKKCISSRFWNSMFLKEFLICAVIEIWLDFQQCSSNEFEILSNFFSKSNHALRREIISVYTLRARLLVLGSFQKIIFCGPLSWVFSFKCLKSFITFEYLSILSSQKRESLNEDVCDSLDLHLKVEERGREVRE